MKVGEKIKNILKHYKNKDYNKAISICESIVKINDKIPEVFNLYGLVLQAQNNHKQAINYFNKSIFLNSRDHSSYNNLANSYKSLYLNDLAIENFEKCLKIYPEYLPALINFAVLKKELNEHKSAIHFFNEALKIKDGSNKIKLLFSIAECYKELGAFQKSIQTLEKVLKLDKNNTAAYYLLSKFINFKDKDTYLKEMEILNNDHNLSDSEKINLWFALGKVFEDKNEYEKSFNFYKDANHKKRKSINYDISYYNNLKVSIINFFQKNNIVKLKNYNDNKIIFICGMPRSGTTLVEQIISSHNRVTASGETSILSNIFGNHSSLLMGNNQDRILNFFSENSLSINNYYFKRLKNLRLDKNVITDKTVQNFIWIGFIRSIFPNSKIIHCYRNPKDTCLSIFKNNFDHSFMSWSYKEQEIIDFYNFYNDLMIFWNNKFPDEIYKIKYETLINDPENEIKKLVSFCDLDWDPSCLNFHNNKYPVKTASSTQVRQPMYKTSQNYSKNYEKFMSPIFDKIKT